MKTQNAFFCFISIFLADFAVRSAYMAGKSPVLPVFSDQLGANEILLGAIVSVSTMTGLVFKPIFGFLSDRNGRWIWIMIGTALFCITPLLYGWVSSIPELVTIRLVHGTATAIYGPVTLAYVAELGSRPKAEWFGWFALSRTGGYVLGPLIGGALLGFLTPVQVLTNTSLIAVLAFIPVILIHPGKEMPKTREIKPVGFAKLIGNTLGEVFSNRMLLVFAIVEMASRIGVYAVKTFLPLIILARGGSPLEAGLFLSIQEASAAMTRPLAGRLSDWHGQHERSAVLGLTSMAVVLALIPWAIASGWLNIIAILLGTASGIYMPAAMALIAGTCTCRAKGTSFGVVGALRNAGKLIGPVLGGWFIYAFSIEHAFFALAGLPMMASALLLFPGRATKSLDGKI